MKPSRKYLSAKGLLNVIHEQFSKIESPVKGNSITLTDCLMSGLALFSLKFPSLLKFDETKEDKTIKHNLRTLYQVNKAPSDTYMRERCDEVEPTHIRKAFKKLFACVQRGKELEAYEYLDKHYLLSGDGTQFFSSTNVHCENCCEKHTGKSHIKFVTHLSENNTEYKKQTYLVYKKPKQAWELYYIDEQRERYQLAIEAIAGLADILKDKPKKALTKEEKALAIELITNYHRANYPNEEVSYYHNMYCAAIVHPDKKLVLPLAPEPIMKSDGDTKNDCERNASRRLYEDARREHPHLKFIVVEDALASNQPHLADLKRLNMRYIVGVKPGDHRYLFDFVNQSECIEYSHQTADGKSHRYRYYNGAPLNKSHADFKVNFLEYWETNKKGKTQHFCWVTDIKITNDNVYDIMRGGRINWRIENNTFNTLKNQGYQFSHNFGHGYKHLSTVFGMLMMLAFFVDQVQELSCHLFKAARAKFKSRTSLWEKIRGMFREHLIEEWDDLFNAIANGFARALIPDTS